MTTTTGEHRKRKIQKIAGRYPSESRSGTRLVREQTETASTGKKKKKIPVVTPPTKKYLDLIRRFPLRPIESKRQNKFALKVFSELMDRSIANKLTPDERAYYNVLSKLIGEFEDKAYDFGPKPTEAEMLEFMMEQHSLRQVDLINELGSQTTVSLILRGKRKMTREQIEKVSKRFHISPAIFFE